MLIELELMARIRKSNMRINRTFLPFGFEFLVYTAAFCQYGNG